MSFASPGVLSLLSLIPLVVLLHMRRHRSHQVPSTAIWRLVAGEESRSPRPSRLQLSVSLLLQTSLIAVAVLALAEPTFGTAQDSHYVLVLDAGTLASATGASGSVSVLEEAWRAWLSEVSSQRGNPTYSVWWVGPWTRPLAIEHSSVQSLERVLARSEHADAQADWLEASRSLSGYDFSNAYVTVFASDASKARAALEAHNPRSLSVRTYKLPPFQVAVTRIDATLLDARTGRWRVEADAQADGDSALIPARIDFSIRFLPEGASVALPYAERSAPISTTGLSAFATELELPGPGVLEVTVTNEDGIRSDNVQRLKLDPDPRQTVVLVVSKIGPQSPTARLLEAAGRFRVIVSQELDGASDVDLVIVEGSHIQVSDPLDASSILWIGTSPSAPVSQIEAGTTAQILRWDPYHPVSRGTNWPESEGLETASVALHGEVLVHGVNGPLVTVQATSRTRQVAIAFDPLNPKFSQSNTFVTLVVDAVNWLAPAKPSVSACRVGAPCILPWSITVQGFEAVAEGASAWGAPTPNPRADIPSRLDEAWIPTRAGLWSLVSSEGHRYVVPVNVARPSAARRPLREEPESSDAPQATGHSVSLLTALLLLYALLLLADGSIGGRSSEPVWRKRALLLRGPAGGRVRFAALLHVIAVVALGAAGARVPFLSRTLAKSIVVVQDGKQAPQDSRDLGLRGAADVVQLGRFFVPDLRRVVDEAAARVDSALDLELIFLTDQVSYAGEATYSFGPPISAATTVHLVDSVVRAMGTDVIAVDLILESNHFVGDVVGVTGVVHSSAATDAEIAIYLDGQPIETWSAHLPDGWSRFTTSVTSVGLVSRVLTLEVKSDQDQVRTNDHFEKVLAPGISPRVVIFAKDTSDAEPWISALSTQGIRAEARSHRTLSPRPESLSVFDAVVLMDVPAIDLVRPQQDAIEAWVREFGGGVVILGGEHSFGPGGYLETPLDTISPVSARISRDTPAVSMLFIIDRSGSMQQVVDGVSRLDIAKQATLSANELLGEGSEIAVVVFDEEARVLLPFTDSSKHSDILRSLAPLVPGGGTSLYPALILAREVIATASASSRHVVVMTDGLSQPGDFEAAVRALVELDATVSAIAIGAGADIERVRNIARAGGGTAHLTTDFRALPSILAQEAMLLGGDPIIETRVASVLTDEGRQFASGATTSLPDLLGLIETTPKVDATVLIEDDSGRPILAAWRYGSGRVLAFTSQATGSWSSLWTASGDFATLWADWLRWVFQPGFRPGVALQSTLVGDYAQVAVTATADNGMPLSNYELMASLIPAQNALSPDRGAVDSTHLVEVEPGRYVGHLPVPSGDWLIEVVEPAGSFESAQVELVRSHESSLSSLAAGGSPVRDLVQLTGGEVLNGSSDWMPTSRWAWMVTRQWKPWLILSLLSWSFMLIQRYAPSLTRWRSVSLHRRTP
ncbi:MAG: VWA domain-containing protein [Trueperaceae bacterium]|nr:VWA domain-containing protein [Trueperaceae bacterium]